MTKRVAFLAVPVAAAAGLVLAGAGSTMPPPGSGYQWAQPNCAPVTTPHAQPPAWIPAAAQAVTMPAPGSSYQWAQPNCAPVKTPYSQPPGGIPTG